MGIIDVVIVLAVVAALALCIRSLAKGGSDCAGCGSSGSCSAHATGKGSCAAAQAMLSDVESALRASKPR